MQILPYKSIQPKLHNVIFYYNKIVIICDTVIIYDITIRSIKDNPC